MILIFHDYHHLQLAAGQFIEIWLLWIFTMLESNKHDLMCRMSWCVFEFLRCESNLKCSLALARERVACVILPSVVRLKLYSDTLVGF